MNTQRIVVIGQGYVGLPVAMRAIEVGMDVVGFDVDQRKIDGMLSGRSHIDDITDADIAAALATGRFLLTGGGEPDQTGWFTLVCVRTGAGWRAVHDHSS